VKHDPIIHVQQCQGLADVIRCPDCTDYVPHLDADRAALLATRDRYEAALREIASYHLAPDYDCTGCRVCVTVAREALAAAQGGDRE
jgi:Pyruvate/2-oxoacid:ferredoxin oxidoreductase delta subunit